MIGIIGAMQIEVEGIIAAMTETKTERFCSTPFTCGKLSGVPVVVARCGAGKVNAAMCAAVMIQRFAPKLIISTGVAGGIGEGVKIGDLVIATHAVQYDYDTTAIGEPKAFVPLGGSGKETVELPTCETYNAILAKYAAAIYSGVHRGVIATGDKFVADPAVCEALKAEFGAVSCEMETGSIAHVCLAGETPFCGLRAISDNANDDGKVDFMTFAKDSAEKCITLLKAAAEALYTA
ncbi:MAG: 5'-methylthioadenosine/adenosylhomocysteine nucleosidase [Clostridia bacterium]|nr:5'-methylthioadenosine/adenosylhomocysteine nucleosidase [Clostridia bacterium]